MSAIEITVSAVNDSAPLPIREIIENMQGADFTRLEIKQVERTSHAQHGYLLFIDDAAGNKTVQRIDTRPGKMR